MAKKQEIAISELIRNRKKLITSKEFAAMLADFYTPRTVSVYLQRGVFPFTPVRIGNRLYVSKTQADNYVNSKLEELRQIEERAELAQE